MSDVKQDLCQKCGRPKSPEKGSLTQWINACMCDLRPVVEEDSLESLEVCGDCKKRIVSGRSGSLTQWVLRSIVCACAVPKPQPASVADASYLADQERQFHAARNQSVVVAPDGVESESELALPPGTFPQNRYKPLNEIGSGASGIVYRCRDRILGKLVAVKCLRTITDEQMVNFQREAKATSQLKHPGVVAVMDFGTTPSGAPYMVMDYSPGMSLEQSIELNGPVPVETARDLFIRIADALAYAHDKRVFHRDLKSSNILLIESGGSEFNVRLIDFGVALVKHANQEPTIVQGKTVIGTPAYMAPDQVSGLEYDARSEIYSLACVMFEALTGRPPFVSESVLETINKHAHEQPPSLSEAFDADFPEYIENIMQRCLKKSKEDRFQTMAAFSDSLRHYGSPPPAEDLKASRTDLETIVPAKPKKELPVFKILAAVVALVLIIAVPMFIINIMDDSAKPRSYQENLSDFMFSGEKLSQQDWTTRNKLPDVSKNTKQFFEQRKRVQTAYAFVPGASMDIIAADMRKYGDTIDTVRMSNDELTSGKLELILEHPTIVKLAFVRVKVAPDVMHKLLADKRWVNIKMKTVDLDEQAWQQIGELDQLTHLGLINVDMNPEKMKSIGRLENLKALELPHNDHIGGHDLIVLRALPKLTNLNLGATGLTDAGLKYISEIKKLKNLNISSNGNFSLYGLEVLANRPNLKVQAARVPILPPDKIASIGHTLRINLIAGGDLPDSAGDDLDEFIGTVGSPGP